MKLQELLDEFTLAGQAKGKSQNTLDWYKWESKRFREWLESQGIPDDVETFDARVFRNYLVYLRGSGYAANTISNGFKALKAMLRFAVLDDLIESDPTAKVDVPKVPNTEIDHFSDDEIYRLLKTCDDQKSIIDLRDSAIMLLLYDTGLRASELVDLNIEDIVDNRRIVVWHGKGDKPRSVPVSPNTLRAITRYLRLRERLHGKQVPNDPLFLSTRGHTLALRAGGRLTRNGLSQLIRRRGAKAGLSAYPHKFRHSFAMAALRNGAREYDIQDILGHSSLDMTKRYARHTPDSLSDAHGHFSPASKLRKV